ncbi:MAG: cytochrome c biogenesis protein CcsA [Myxococcales bacterium]|nr:cytochrome c biogenesis protein CcsA [Myxococcales bacterium]
MDIFFAIGAAAYAITTIGYLIELWTARPGVGRVSLWLLRGTLIYALCVMVAWAIFAGFAGGTRLGLSLSAWSLGALYLFMQRRYPIQALGSFIAALATLLSVFALLVSRPLTDLVSAPVADWLLRIHIGLAFLGVTAFGFATAFSIVYLLQARMLKRKGSSPMRRRLPPLDVLDRLSLRSIIIGFPFYTIALLLGSAEAMRIGSGGLRVTYVLAVISWLIYGAVLQARLTAGWRGRRAAVLTTLGLVTSLVVVALYSLGIA